MSDKEKAKEELKKLIQRYHNQRAEIVNEQQVCDSLVRPFFNKVLGWDTEDPSEFRSQFSQRGKRIDYLSFLNGISQFVIEVKELNHEIRHNFQDYGQTLNYAKNKDKPFAILTNFSQFIILRADTETTPLQCEVRAIGIEKAVDSEADFDLLWTFQKEVWAAEKGDALYKLKPGKKSLPVDKLLVNDLKKWRIALLTNLKKHPKLNDFADFEKEMPYIEQEVQRFIDRLIFICYCEDKELKEKGLKNLLETKESDYSGKEAFLVKGTKELFDDYRKQYDSDLFFEQGYCDKFRFEDAVLAEILRDLRKPFKKVPYDFSAIESDVLGKAYENFIGHVVTGTKRFKETESISKRKEEGVYYTPQYIVNYIVDNTLRNYIKENRVGGFDSLLKIRVLDPACGSGTFLIRAFEVLEEEARKILGVKELSYAEKINLMTNCIFGVDKDERAVDIAKLRLSLTLAARQKLPELSKNVQCGDSLIDDIAVAGEKAFNWQERFKDVMQNGGFDVVVGNPPYGADLDQKATDFLLQTFSTNQGEIESFKIFMEKATTLLKQGGRLGFIVPNTWLYIDRSQKIRDFILTKSKLVELFELAKYVFEDAPDLVPVIVVFEKENNQALIKSNKCKVKATPLKGREKDFLIGNLRINSFVKQEVWLNNFKRIINLALTDVTFRLLRKIEKDTLPFNKLAVVKYGIKTGDNEKNTDKTRKNDNYKKCLFGRDIARYSISWNNVFLNYGKNLPGYRTDNVEVQKILVQYTRKLSLIRRIVAALDEAGDYYPLNSLSYIYSNSDVPNKTLLGVLNSNLMNFYFSNMFIDIGIKPVYLIHLPIKKLSNKIKDDLVNSVDKILSLHKRLNELGDKHTVERERVEEEIKKTDAEIDELVYKLYGITEEEKKIIEDALR